MTGEHKFTETPVYSIARLLMTIVHNYGDVTSKTKLNIFLCNKFLLQKLCRRKNTQTAIILEARQNMEHELDSIIGIYGNRTRSVKVPLK